ncbi:hypothetical protein [Klebsiella pneumoniae ISC21]|nr:hypothetical protein [Klebsiella pneumoniae ISC21]
METDQSDAERIRHDTCQPIKGWCKKARQKPTHWKNFLKSANDEWQPLQMDSATPSAWYLAI